MWNTEEINHFDSNNLKHGLWKSFFLHSEQVSCEEKYTHGILNGFCKYFWSNGEIKREGNFINGQQVGLWIYNPNSLLSKEIIFIR